MDQKDSEKENLIERDSDLLDVLGGEPLQGSGFENEIPEPSSDWRDPR